MSRDNLCIGLERDYEEEFPIACKLFRKIIDNFSELSPEECMQLYDIFRDCCNSNEGLPEQYITDTYLV